jgi:uncharacterized protein HemX
MAEKKPAAAADGTKKSDNKLLVIGGVMIALGLAWGAYEFNPGGMLREKTKDEKKADKDAVQLEMEKARAAKRKQRR